MNEQRAGYAVRKVLDELVRLRGEYYDELDSAQLHPLVDEAVAALFIVKEELL